MDAGILYEISLILPEFSVSSVAEYVWQETYIQIGGVDGCDFAGILSLIEIGGIDMS